MWRAKKTRTIISELAKRLDDAVEELMVHNLSFTSVGAHRSQLVGTVQNTAATTQIKNTVTEIATAMSLQSVTHAERHNSLVALSTMSERERLVSMMSNSKHRA